MDVVRNDSDEYSDGFCLSRRPPGRLCSSDKDFLERAQTENASAKICFRCFGPRNRDLRHLLDLPAGFSRHDPGIGTR